MAGKKDKKVKIYRKKKNIPEEKIIGELQSRYDDIDEAKITKFSDLPLSPKTQKGLREHNFVEPTDIQKQSIGLALRGNDILGAAKTGSGKTLAFLVPVLEILYCNRWTRMDGVGALIITPTRELAYQIYETLRKVGSHHDISAGLVIGGKDLQFEKKRMDQCNIVICTPGRLLQHMDENPLFDCVTVKVLVLDEADRCLDMGFENTMNAIIENLPPERQTLLFSATQTKSVRDLARLSLKNPIYISVHEHAEHTTPEGLQQSYVICNLEDKMGMLWSFIRHHLRQKVIIFFSSCKQVKYTYEVFCRMRPGISLLALYGKLHQLKRMSIYESFCKKQHAVLFATDIAARGLDFPAVNWVVHMDCPEDANAYIHRAGRTARFERGGESLLVLVPSEEQMVERLRERRIPISMIKINPNKLNSPHRKLEALLARDVALKESAQRAFVAYVKSVFLMKDKEIFNVHALDTDAYARSLGLAIPPRIRFLQRMQKDSSKAKDKSRKNEKSRNSSKTDDDLTAKMLQSKKSSDAESDGDSSTDDDSIENEEHVEAASNGRKHDNDNALFANDDSDDEDDILTVKRKNVQIEDELPEDFDEEAGASSKNKKAVTKAAMAKKLLRKKIVPNKKTTFDEEGQELVDSAKSKVSELAKMYENEDSSGINIEIAKQILREEDRFDKKRFQAKIKEKHREEKRKLKASKKVARSDEEDDEDEDEDRGVQLADYESGSEAEEPDLSWLPDPDKIYGPKKGSDQESSAEHSERDEDEEGNERSAEDSEDEEEAQIHRPSKRKLVTQEEFKKSKKKQKIDKIKENSDLQATEELALQLLRN